MIAIAASAIADATAADAYASAQVGTDDAAIIQEANADSGLALASLVNDGSLTISAVASADARTRTVGLGTTATTVVGDASAYATIGIGIHQSANGLSASAVVTNDTAGVIDVRASAKARGNSVFAGASVGTGILQEAFGHAVVGTTTTLVGAGPAVPTINVAVGGNASATLANSGSIAVGATASTSGTGAAVASATVDAGVHQVVSGGAVTVVNGTGTAATTAVVRGDAVANMTNDGSISVNALANATGTSASAHALASYAMWQEVNQDVVGTGVASANMTNNATVALSASANASGTAFAAAYATANTVMYQEVDGTAVAAFLSNAGTATATANAVAVASSGFAETHARAVGMGQDIGGTGCATIVNEWHAECRRACDGDGGSAASASALATGAYQETDPVALNFTNSGAMNVDAAALATSYASFGGSAYASANGYLGTGGGGERWMLRSQSGTDERHRYGTAPGTATAVAHGIVVSNEATATPGWAPTRPRRRPTRSAARSTIGNAQRRRPRVGLGCFGDLHHPDHGGSGNRHDDGHHHHSAKLGGGDRHPGERRCQQPHHHQLGYDQRRRDHGERRRGDGLRHPRHHQWRRRPRRSPTFSRSRILGTSSSASRPTGGRCSTAARRST